MSSNKVDIARCTVTNQIDSYDLQAIVEGLHSKGYDIECELREGEFVITRDEI